MYWSTENRRCSFSTVLIFYRSSLPWSSATRLSRELLTAMILLSVSLQTVSCCSFRTNVISVIVPSFSFSTFLLILLSKLDTVPSFSAWNLQCLPSIFFTRASSSSLDISVSVLKSVILLFLTLLYICAASLCALHLEMLSSHSVIGLQLLIWLWLSSAVYVASYFLHSYVLQWPWVFSFLFLLRHLSTDGGAKTHI